MYNIIKSHKISTQRGHLELVYSQCADPSKDIIIGKTVEETVYGDGHVSWLYWASVKIPVILWQQVDIVEYEALVILNNQS